MSAWRFPAELQQFMATRAFRAATRFRPREHVAWLPHAIRPSAARAALLALEHHMAPFLVNVRAPIPRETITGMRENFTEQLPKSLLNQTVMLGPRSRAIVTAHRIGLVPMLLSRSLHLLAERVSGERLHDEPGMQLIRYRTGDYVGPHNDHHPEEKHLRDGYVDLQITLCNRDVRRQVFLHERHGYLNQAVDVGISSGLSVSRLPYWHQVTPLEARRGRERSARRWLLLVSFEIAA